MTPTETKLRALHDAIDLDFAECGHQCLWMGALRAAYAMAIEDVEGAMLERLRYYGFESLEDDFLKAIRALKPDGAP